MSETIYAWLLRLYPSKFREAYGDEAMQLFRDRARDEKGLLPKARLWLDLVFDLAISVPGAYRTVQPALIGASGQQHVDGIPSFQLLEDESLRFGTILFGGVLSLGTLAALWALINHAGDYPPRRASVIQGLPPTATRRPVVRSPAALLANHAEDEAVASGLPPRLVQGRRSQSAAGALFQTAAEDARLDAAERRRVMDAAARDLKEHYVEPDIAQKMVDALLAHEKAGDDDAVTGGTAFAHLLTKQMRDVSHDMNLEVVYSRNPIPDRPPGLTPERLAAYREAMEQDHCTFQKVEILPHNIGYLKLNSFPDPALCQTTATAAMARLNQADAIIFDLRDSRGGDPSMVSMIAAYLFDHPEYLYNPRENTTEQSWTRSPVSGNSLANKPVYLLTSSSTISGAEQFSYDLKMLKRATLVGETTGGAAHAGVFHRIDDHFGMGIPEVRAINPFSRTDWEETGVEPDVKVKAADALETAEMLAATRLQKK